MRRTRIATISLLLVLSFAVLSITINPAESRDLYYNHYASDLYSTTWLMQDSDLGYITQAFSQVYDMFASLGLYYFYPGYGWVWSGYYTYSHLENFENQTTLQRVTDQITHCEGYHDFSTVFYYGHMNFQNVGYDWPYYSYGFREAAPVDAQTANTIWDRDIVDYSSDNHHFVFLWVCHNGNVGGSSDEYGMPYAWTHQNLNQYGQDDSGYCFIGFQNASATFSEIMFQNATLTSIYKHWLVFFYYYALWEAPYRRDVYGALDQASKQAGYNDGWTDQYNRLSQGYYYWWPGGGGTSNGTFWGKMRTWGDYGIYLPGNMYSG